jgi:thymidylate synthase (FAD)
MTVKVAKPQVYVIASTKLNKSGLMDFLGAEGCDEQDDIHHRSISNPETQDASLLPEIAGRVCYSSYGRKKDTNGRYVGHIIEVGHGSVLEHSNVTLAFTGISRTLTHELVRHRAGFGYSQRSQRFVNEGDFEVVIPPLFEQLGWEELSGLVQEAAEQALENYKTLAEKAFEKLSTEESIVEFAIREHSLLPIQNGTDYILPEVVMEQNQMLYAANKEGWIEALKKDTKTKDRLSKETLTARRKTAREAARSVLPNATETKIFVTGNLRAWRTMLDQRASKHADREIRRLAIMVLRALKEEAPEVFADYTIQVDNQGVEYAETKYKKV